MYIKINKHLPRYRKGMVVHVLDDGGSPPQPRDNYWRRRLKDSERDGCCEIFNKRHAPVEDMG